MECKFSSRKFNERFSKRLDRNNVNHSTGLTCDTISDTFLLIIVYNNHMICLFHVYGYSISLNLNSNRCVVSKTLRKLLLFIFVFENMSVIVSIRSIIK